MIEDNIDRLRLDLKITDYLILTKIDKKRKTQKGFIKCIIA